ncbi:unnamed protein product [Effrenium voratum]|uniref:UFSP1/2/DUB catalytic domain-containing protein n=1 Tax=Effrenium voratum TaxID=2562239 RepID=A0AA36JR64_9DINO|nr:unnamed protein product [Effrenium voratum]
MRLTAKPISGFVSGADGSVAAVAPEAGALWLVGRRSPEELCIWSAWDSTGFPPSELLPHGLEVLGRFAPAELRAKGEGLTAWRDEGGQLCGEIAGQQLGPCQVVEPTEVLVRSSLELLPTSELPELRFLLGNSAPSLPELRAGSAGSAKMEGAVEVLFDSDTGRTNFLSLGSEMIPPLRLDFAAYVAKGASAAQAAEQLTAAAQTQLAKRPSAAVRCYLPETLGHAVLLGATEDPLWRKELHRLLRLPEEPLLLPGAALPLPGQAHPCATGKPTNPHSSCGPQPGWWKGSQDTTGRAFVRGLYEYNHYMQDSFDDNGWGCAYRSLQTCVSWYRLQHYSGEAVPSIPEIQRLLKRIDEAHKDLEVGSKKWIGTVEGMYLLQEYLKVDCKMMYCQDAADMASQAPQMLQHLKTEGTPIMMGAGMYAYTLVGLCFDSASGEVAYLIVDPHYTGQDDLKPILQKGWVGWKNLEFFEKSTEGSFINCCLPLVPRGPGCL